MTWKPTSQTARNFPGYTEYYNRLVSAYDNLSKEERSSIPLDVFISEGMKKVTGSESPQLFQAEMALNNPQGGQLHNEQSALQMAPGSKPGRIESVSDFWLGPKNPMTFKEQGAGMGMGWKDRTSGNQVNFRREVSPYMMFNNPNDPTMWDELPDPGTPMHRTFTEAEQGAWESAYKGDRAQDSARQLAEQELKRKNLKGYMDLRSSGMLDQILDAMMMQVGGE